MPQSLVSHHKSHGFTAFWPILLFDARTKSQETSLHMCVLSFERYSAKGKGGCPMTQLCCQQAALDPSLKWIFSSGNFRPPHFSQFSILLSVSVFQYVLVLSALFAQVEGIRQLLCTVVHILEAGNTSLPLFMLFLVCFLPLLPAPPATGLPKHEDPWPISLSFLCRLKLLVITLEFYYTLYYRSTTSSLCNRRR